MVPLEADLVSFAEFRDGRGVGTFQVREALDRLLRVAVGPVTGGLKLQPLDVRKWLCPAKARVEARENQCDARETRAACVLERLVKIVENPCNHLCISPALTLLSYQNHP